MEKEIIISDFNRVFSDLDTTVASFDNISFNQVPFEGSWTPAQVTQHLKLANGNFADVLRGDVKETERPADELKSTIKNIFLNFDTKFKSPDFILPELKEYDREQHLHKIRETQQQITKAINDLDLTKTCASFQLPGLGYLTRLEAIYFVIYHTERHVHQLREIRRFQKHLKSSIH